MRKGQTSDERFKEIKQQNVPGLLNPAEAEDIDWILAANKHNPFALESNREALQEAEEEDEADGTDYRDENADAASCSCGLGGRNEEEGEKSKCAIF